MPHYKDQLRLVRLFGKPYYWHTVNGHLTLRHARWALVGEHGPETVLPRKSDISDTPTSG